jgi:1,4-dihydroxy-2-naphthoate octaprenyltransferase
MELLRRASPYVRHLRLPFQATLAPIFLWGALLAGGEADAGTAAAFIALHLFLYPAATAFNSAYDRDVGPVGGMAAPPPVPPGLLRFSLGLGAAGGIPAAAAGVGFLGLYLLIVLWTVAYSHPRTRWKSGPVASALAIALGQGALGFAAGWAAMPSPSGGAAAFALGAASAALTALGLYPLTQIFQVGEDRARGDRTLAVVLGPVRALRLGSLCLVLGAAAGAAIASLRFGIAAAAAVVPGYALLILAQEMLARRVDELDRDRLYSAAMRNLNAGSAGFLLFLLWLALR